MTRQTFAQHRAEFIRQFNALAQHKRRYEVFRDFVTLGAISLNNVMEPDAERKAGAGVRVHEHHLRLQP